MRIVSVVGARPQFVKLAPIAREFQRRHLEHVVIHTGQHYDPTMSDSFFADFAMRQPDVNLGIGSGGHGAQTGAILTAIEPELERVRPDCVLVYGDTNSTIAATLAAVKLGIRVAHLEAGLRSFNRSMPEEHNRVLTDHAADLLLAPTPTAVTHLAREGLGERTTLVGDVMADICLTVAKAVAADPPAGVGLPAGDFVVATLHRPYNTDHPARLAALVDALAASPIRVLLPAHPRLVQKATDAGIELERGAITVVQPLGYPTLIHAVRNARAVITDSGGLQKEAYLLGVPCTTVRSETEWTETLTDGWNVLCFEDVAAISRVALREIPLTDRQPFYGSGDAAAKTADALLGQAGATARPV